jgi:diguanylate cyclase (GGDEF)-like protein/PAS domain S-box-containing protein
MDKETDFYKDIIDNLYDGVYFVDRERVITYWNHGAERITGYDAQKVIGRSCRDNILNHVNSAGIQLCQEHCPMAACMEDGNPREAHVFLHHVDGHRVPILIRAVPIRDMDGNISGAVETFSADLDASAASEELYQLRSSVLMDPLTGIGNRQFLEGRLKAALAEFDQSSETRTGLLFLDIDHFKMVNDNYGHGVGDQVLHMLAATLQNNIRKSDVIGRWGGEEFLAILYDVPTLKAVNAIADKLRMLIQYSRLDLDNASIAITMSIGGTLLKTGETLESFIHRADQLMYQSKEAGRNRVSVG